MTDVIRVAEDRWPCQDTGYCRYQLAQDLRSGARPQFSRASPSTIDADAIVWLTCGSVALPGGPQRIRSSLLAALLSRRQRSALILSFRHSYLAGRELLLALLLMQRGYSLGSVASRLNLLAARGLGRGPAVVLLGNPSLKLPTSIAEPAVQVRRDARELHVPARSAVLVRCSDGGVLTVDLDRTAPSLVDLQVWRFAATGLAALVNTSTSDARASIRLQRPSSLPPLAVRYVDSVMAVAAAGGYNSVEKLLSLAARTPHAGLRAAAAELAGKYASRPMMQAPELLGHAQAQLLSGVGPRIEERALRHLRSWCDLNRRALAVWRDLAEIYPPSLQLLRRSGARPRLRVLPGACPECGADLVAQDYHVGSDAPRHSATCSVCPFASDAPRHLQPLAVRTRHDSNGTVRWCVAVRMRRRRWHHVVASFTLEAPFSLPLVDVEFVDRWLDGRASSTAELTGSCRIRAGLPRGLYPSTVVMLCDGEPVQVRRSFLWGGSTTVGETEDSAARFTAGALSR